MGTLSSNCIKSRMSSQWSQIKSQQQTIIKNNFSQQQFHVHSIPNIDQNLIKLYFVRQFSCLPHTPKIICLEKQETQLIVLVERFNQSLSLWLQQINCQLAVLMKLSDVLHGIVGLMNKFGEFIITQKMIQLSVNDKIMIWFNEKFHSNLIQLPLTKNQTKNEDKNNETIMVQNIIGIFRKNRSFSFFITSITQNVRTFKNFQLIVKRRIHQIQRDTKTKVLIQSYASSTDVRQRYKISHQRQISKRNLSIVLENQNFQKNTLQTQKNSSNIVLKKRHKSFLLEQAQKQKENELFEQFNHQNQNGYRYLNQNKFQIALKNQASSSQRCSSSNVSSKQFIKETLISGQNFRPWRSFNHISLSKNSTKQPSTFRKKQCGYKNLTIYQTNEKQSQKVLLQNQSLGQQNNNVYFLPILKSLSPTHGYKACESFSSTKQFSLKSTTGTLKKTREFNDQMFRQLIMAQRQAIKQQSDETYKNSNNYSVETIKQELKEEQRCSLTVSQDFHQLFSGRQSNNECDEQTQIREMQFERVLWDGE